MRYPSLARDPSGSLQLYYGIGPMVEASVLGRQSRHTDVGQSGLRAGASGSLGAEWFVHPRISIAGEYRKALSLFYETQTSDGSAYGVDLAVGHAFAVVSLYF